MRPSTPVGTMQAAFDCQVVVDSVVFQGLTGFLASFEKTACAALVLVEVDNAFAPA